MARNTRNMKGNSFRKKSETNILLNYYESYSICI